MVKEIPQGPLENRGLHEMGKENFDSLFPTSSLTFLIIPGLLH